jgi:hypothetical protein
MKKNKYFLPLLAVASLGVLIAACEKKDGIASPELVTAGAKSDMAHVKVVHAAPNFRDRIGVPDSLDIYLNGIKINSGSNFTYGNAFPANPTAPNSAVGTYAAVRAGAVNVRVVRRGASIFDSATVANIPTILAAGGYYSFIITDSVRNLRDSSRIFVRDNFPIPNPGRYALRLIHAAADSADRRIDIWSSRRNNYLYNNIPSGFVGSFIIQPQFSVADTLIVRRAGTMTELARINNIIFTDQRVYTLLYRGKEGLTSGTKARSLIYYLHR